MPEDTRTEYLLGVSLAGEVRTLYPGTKEATKEAAITHAPTLRPWLQAGEAIVCVTRTLSIEEVPGDAPPPV